MSSKHLFALFSHQVPTTTKNNAIVTFADADLWRRITQVLRLTGGDYLILFNDTMQVCVELDATTFSNKKNIISGVVESYAQHALYTPAIHAMIGLTKREAFEEIVYTCSQLGITSLTPLLTNRVHRNWITDKDMVRLHKIMIAACEQAKQFMPAELRPPLQLSNVLIPRMQNAFVCTPNGQPLLQNMQFIVEARPEELTIFIGPEGGFDDHEELLLTDAGVQQVALGKSILRTQDAAQVLLGSWRSLPI